MLDLGLLVGLLVAARVKLLRKKVYAVGAISIDFEALLKDINLVINKIYVNYGPVLEMGNFTKRNDSKKYCNNFTKRNARRKYWNLFMIMALRRNGTALPMNFTNRNGVPVHFEP